MPWMIYRWPWRKSNDWKDANDVDVLHLGLWLLLLPRRLIPGLLLLHLGLWLLLLPRRLIPGQIHYYQCENDPTRLVAID